MEVFLQVMIFNKVGYIASYIQGSYTIMNSSKRNRHFQTEENTTKKC